MVAGGVKFYFEQVYYIRRYRFQNYIIQIYYVLPEGLSAGKGR